MTGLSQKGLRNFFKLVPSIFLILILISFVIACTTPLDTTPEPVSSSPADNSKATTTITVTPTSTATTVAPQGEFVAAIETFGNENYIPWSTSLGAANIVDLVYDFLIYWDYVNLKFLPGLAESWEVSPDGLTLTYHLRKGVQFTDGWGELNSEDVKYNFEMQASTFSVGKTAQCRRIASMDTPDPYTLIVHFKDPYPTFYVDLSSGNSGVCQGIVSKKYVETVGEEAASQKPVGTGPYRVIEYQPGSFFKFEALENHWRVVPEFKTLTVRLISETSTLIASLKNKEIDLASIPVDRLAELKAANVSTEASPVGGSLILVSWGGMVVPEDKRYDATRDNKDPWTDVRVRKAMTLAIDREAIVKAIYNGLAQPVGVPVYSMNMDKYQYPYDPEAARQLLKEAGYPDGFSFNAMSYTQPGGPEMPRLIEALAGYWQQIGLDPKITVIDFASYLNNNFHKCNTAGNISLAKMSPVADMLTRVELYFMPNAVSPYYQDAGSYAIYNQTPKATIEERLACVDKLNQYYYENYGPIPLVKFGATFAWNGDKISPWPHASGTAPLYLEYVRHAQPLNTFRLFTPWPGR